MYYSECQEKHKIEFESRVEKTPILIHDKKLFQEFLPLLTSISLADWGNYYI